jgi:hypothetical protein
MDVNGQLHAPATLLPGKEVTYWIGGWVGPKAILDAAVKRKIPSPPWESNIELRSSSFNFMIMTSRKMGITYICMYVCVCVRARAETPMSHSMKLLRQLPTAEP